MATTTTNKQYTLNWNDLTRGLLLAVISTVLTALLDALQKSGFDNIDWKAILLVGATTAVSYLVKNFFTPSEIVVQGASQGLVSAVKEGTPVQVGGTVIPPKTAA